MASRYNLRSRDTVEAEPEIQEKEPKKRRKLVVEEEEEDVSTSSPEESSSSSSRHRHRQAKENGRKNPRYVLIDPEYENRERADRSNEEDVDDGNEETTSLDGFIIPDIKPKSRLRKWVNPDIMSTNDEEAEDESYELGSVEPDVEMEPGEVEEEGEAEAEEGEGEAEGEEEVEGEEEGGGGEEEEESYFTLETNPLVDFLTAKLIKKLGPDSQIPPAFLRQAVQNAIQRAEEDLVDDYCGAVPKDEKWKVGLDEETISRLEPILKKIRETQRVTAPTIVDILEAPILMTQKAEALAFYDMIQNMEPYTPKRHYAEKELLRMIGKFDNAWTTDIPENDLEKL